MDLPNLLEAFVDAVPIVFQLEIRCEVKLILARVSKKQFSYFVVAWPNVQTLSLLLQYTQNIYSRPFKMRGMSVSTYTSFPLFRALWSPVGNPALMRFSGLRQGFFALTKRLNLRSLNSSWSLCGYHSHLVRIFLLMGKGFY